VGFLDAKDLKEVKYLLLCPIVKMMFFPRMFFLQVREGINAA
jgi:hypothetical protein